MCLSLFWPRMPYLLFFGIVWVTVELELPLCVPLMRWRSAPLISARVVLRHQFPFSFVASKFFSAQGSSG